MQILLNKFSHHLKRLLTTCNWWYYIQLQYILGGLLFLATHLSNMTQGRNEFHCRKAFPLNGISLLDILLGFYEILHIMSEATLLGIIVLMKDAR